MKDRDQVLIVGGGPVGFAMAAGLARVGIPFTLLEEGDEIFEDPRAATVHPPSLELFQQLGLAQRFIDRGIVVRHFQYRDRKEGLVAEFDLNLLANETPYPFRLMLEQHKISAMLYAHLENAAQGEVLFSHRVQSVSQDENGVSAEAVTPDGAKTLHGRYLIGCDGGRSLVRKAMGVSFEGFAFAEKFLVVSTPFDFGAKGFAYTNYVADPVEWCALFKVKGLDDQGIWRVVFPTRPDELEADIFDDGSIEKRLQGFTPQPATYKIVHRNLYEVHQRVASTYRRGRFLLAGDAAHINNPLGGMGMNFGFHDAFNLCDKLSKIWFESGSEDSLDLYDRQRRTVAKEYLQIQTIQNKKNLEEKDPAVRAAHLNEMRRMAAEPEQQFKYLMRAAMIDGVRRADSIS